MVYLSRSIDIGSDLPPPDSDSQPLFSTAHPGSGAFFLSTVLVQSTMSVSLSCRRRQLIDPDTYNG
jgi:hypothetical protein